MTELGSTRDGTTPANSLAEKPSFSTTGQFLAFASAASNLGANTANGIENVFARNTCITHHRQLHTLDCGGEPAGRDFIAVFEWEQCGAFDQR